MVRNVQAKPCNARNRRRVKKENEMMVSSFKFQPQPSRIRKLQGFTTPTNLERNLYLPTTAAPGNVER